MEDQTNSVIQPLVITESMVTALVCYDPNTGANTALNIKINRPRQEGERLREVLDVGGSNVVNDRNNGEVVKDIGEGADDRALKTMRWDGFLDLPEAERRLSVRNSLDGVSFSNFTRTGGSHISTGTHYSDI